MREVGVGGGKKDASASVGVEISLEAEYKGEAFSRIPVAKTASHSLDTPLMETSCSVRRRSLGKGEDG